MEHLTHHNAPNVGNLSHVWSVYCCVALQTCATCLAFGAFVAAKPSKCGEFISRLEALVWRIAPNVGNPSRVWSVFYLNSLFVRNGLHIAAFYHNLLAGIFANRKRRILPNFHSRSSHQASINRMHVHFATKRPAHIT